MLAACGSVLALSGCQSGASEATRISRLLLSNRLEEPRRVVLYLTRAVKPSSTTSSGLLQPLMV